MKISRQSIKKIGDVLNKATSKFRKDDSLIKIGDVFDNQYEVDGIEDHKLTWICRVFDIKDPTKKYIAKRWKNLVEDRELIEREIRIISLIADPNTGVIPQLVRPSNQYGWIIYEYIDGKQLVEEVNANVRYDSKKAINLIIELCDLLKPIHQRGIVHRRIDLKHIIRRTQDRKLFIVDFSESQRIDIDTEIEPYERIATDFTPPQLNSTTPKFDEDIYSIGIIALLSLTRFNSLSSLVNEEEVDGALAWAKHANEADIGLIKVVSQMIDKSSRIRYQNIEEVLDAINNIEIELQPKSNPTIQIPTIEPDVKLPSNHLQLSTIQSSTKHSQLSTIQSQNIEPEIKLPSKHSQPSSYVSTKFLPTMVTIESGSFMMGSAEKRSERPAHQVSIATFQMSATPITQAQWKYVMESDLNPSHHQGDNYPVESITWLEAREFCKKLSSLSQDGKVYRLPSESEWEYACKANTNTMFYFGDDLDSLQANFANNEGTSTEVKRFKANHFGLYDMHGNVWEWCEDSYVTGYKDAPIDGSAVTKTEETNNDEKVVRGGAWNTNKFSCSSTSRYSIQKNESNNNCGFRVVTDIQK
ncbi:SUMF1/EgtB/PvdO family nonheme iron enzyme [Chamaesiphon minutus]|uniref:Protein kinase domain-containing protein n=1 Tax=Chamaesiphon minutus (strain ATCC 27169 / PCC 6605) TaxID=1173020 RepID=K9US27_CHAP6|nr:SUMF1/EgtB/PvdO family nonheme iron enzyme [Chamaesiphon minutus]AFY97246.1 hypothetical protein Cha6605_6429 [Chamaesiphon minutus PCC 6605]